MFERLEILKQKQRLIREERELIPEAESKEEQILDEQLSVLDEFANLDVDEPKEDIRQECPKTSANSHVLKEERPVINSLRKELKTGAPEFVLEQQPQTKEDL